MSSIIEISKIKSDSSLNSDNLCQKPNTIYNNINNPIFKNHQGIILSLLVNKNSNKNKFRRSSIKTADTDKNSKTKMILSYNSSEIKKFDELNNSFSNISEFDLEKGKNGDDSEFNSSEIDDDSIEEEDIVTKTKKKEEKKNDSEFEIELEKNFEDIVNMLYNKQ